MLVDVFVVKIHTVQVTQKKKYNIFSRKFLTATILALRYVNPGYKHGFMITTITGRFSNELIVVEK